MTPWDFSCPDWEERIRTGRSLMPALPLFRADADRALAVFNKLRVPDIPDRPRLKEAAGEWLKEIVAALFGSVDPATGFRYMRELFLLVPKKNNKTTGAAGIMMTALLLNKRPRVEFHLVGPTQDNADQAFDQCLGMIEADDIKQQEETGQPGYLKQILHVQSHLKRITFTGTKQKPGTGAKLRIKTFSEKIATGPRPAGLLLDEIHLLGKDAKAPGIIGQMRGGMVSNPLAFLLMLTTQSWEAAAGVFDEELQRARMVRDGKVKGGTLLPILYEFPDEIIESGAWRDPATWPMINPNLERSVFLHLLKGAWQDAQTKGEIEIRRWASQHLNIPVSLAFKDKYWKGAKYWEGNTLPAEEATEVPLAPIAAGVAKARRLEELAEMLANCEVAVISTDGGGLDDLYGVCVLGREKNDSEEVRKRTWRAWFHAFCFRSVLEERQDIASQLLDFEKDGDLTIVDDPGDDIIEICNIVEMVRDAGLLPEKNAFGADTHGLSELIEALASIGFDTSAEAGWLRGISQGWQLKGAIDTTGRRLKAGRLKHSESRMMVWVLGNAKIEPRGNAIMITKQVSGSAKIDPLLALFNGVALMSLNPQASGSVAIHLI